MPATGEEAPWILWHALDQYLKVQMRTGGASGRANFADFLAAFDKIAVFDEHGGHMRIQSPNIIAVIDFNHDAVAGVDLLVDGYSGGRGNNGSAAISLKIQSAMQSRLPRDGVDAPAEHGAHHAA